MIASISAGKSTLLNIFFNIDLLETAPDISTKFVTIIRYNPQVKDNPIFYELKIKNTGNDNYDFYKNENSEIKGSKNIKGRIKEINGKLKKSSEVNYDELFCMLEIGENNFMEEEYLKNYDLLDVPGISEYLKGSDENSTEIENAPTEKSISVEKMMSNYAAESEKNYLTEIFKRIKNKMVNGIMIFSIDEISKLENYTLIGKLQKIINKPIENFLILVNKSDTSVDIESHMINIKSNFMEQFPNCEIFNFSKNEIIPCSAFQLENELKMNKSFTHLLYYYFINFLTNKQYKESQISFIDSLNILLKSDQQSIPLNHKDFIETLTQIINDNPKLTKIIQYVNEFIEKVEKNHRNFINLLGIKREDFNENKIQEYLDNENENEENVIDYNSINENLIILYYYSEFEKGKNIPDKSQNIKSIINYFTMEYIKNKLNYQKIETDIQKYEDETTYNKEMNDILKKIKEFEDYYKDNCQNLESNHNFYFTKLTGILKSFKTYFIPILGEYNTGKSTILNGLIGNELLDSSDNECTKKGILINHWNQDFPILRKARLNKYKCKGNDYYYFEIDKNIIAEGSDNIKNIIKACNGKFSDNEEDFFYQINVKMKFVEDNFGNNNILKEKICFVDLPGLGTTKQFENKAIFNDVIKMCHLFLFVFKNHVITDGANKSIISKLFSILTNNKYNTNINIVKQSLFIDNLFSLKNEEHMTENKIMEIKEKLIQEQFFNYKKEEITKDMKITFFDSKIYKDFFQICNYFNNLEELFKNEYSLFLKEKENFYKGYTTTMANGSTFETFLKNKLKNKSKEFKNSCNLKNIQISKNIEVTVDSIIKKK